MQSRQLLAITLIFAVSGCTSLPRLNDTSSYSKMNCAELDAEIASVQQHEAYAKDNASFGFMDVLSAITAGIAGGTGRTDLAAQQNQLDVSLSQQHAQGQASAEAHSNRLVLLNKIKGVRKCV